MAMKRYKPKPDRLEAAVTLTDLAVLPGDRSAFKVERVKVAPMK
jgi:hypothetical protein